MGDLMPAFAGCEECEDGFKIITDFRWRGEADGKDFNSDTDLAVWSTLRARLGIRYKLENVSSFFQLQYPHKLGWNSNTLATNYNADVHQAYLNVSNLFMEGLYLRVGRTELSYGDERLIGSVDWSNIGRVFDGMIFTYYVEDQYWADVFVTQQIERSNTKPDTSVAGKGFEKDDLFLGCWGMHIPLKVNVFFFHNRNAGQNTAGGWATNYRLSTMGIHYSNHYKDMGVKALFDFAMQIGTRKNLSVSPATETDISAVMFVIGAWYSLDIDPLESVGAGIDFSSGDNDATDDKNTTFNNLYYTGHKWRGYMDYFTGSGNQGLRDIFVDLKMKCILTEDAYWKLTFHNFTSHAKYASEVDNSEANVLGNEIDLTFTYEIQDNLKLHSGVGYFMPSEDWKGEDADNSLWAFLQLQAHFGKKCYH